MSSHGDSARGLGAHRSRKGDASPILDLATLKQRNRTHPLLTTVERPEKLACPLSAPVATSTCYLGCSVTDLLCNSPAGNNELPNAGFAWLDVRDEVVE